MATKKHHNNPPKQDRIYALSYYTVDRLAQAMLPVIRREFGDVPLFTREDLMQLDLLDGVSTITRYAYVCATVTMLVQRGQLTRMERNFLALGKAKPRITDSAVMPQAHFNRIGDLVKRFGPGLEFGVMDVVGLWADAGLLSLDCRRRIVRSVLHGLRRAGEVEEGTTANRYRRPGKSNVVRIG